jgi:glycosyltransferase involved in cell wall biosynthesis
MAKIVTVYNDRSPRLVDMSYIRWFKISEALARRGHQVDIATKEFSGWRRRSQIEMGTRLRRVPISEVRWHEYDVVKTLFHRGFDLLQVHKGLDHPFIISKLGSVVGSEDMAGIYFYGKRREALYETQIQISQNSKYVTLLSNPAKDLWAACFGSHGNLLLVPGGVDRDVPPPSHDPFPPGGEVRCLFAGNVYDQFSQPEANAVLIDKLNKLGKYLAAKGIRLYLLGLGDVRRLDPSYVTFLGVVPYEETWNYFYFSHVGIVIAAGKFMHNNESTKIYHYLRVGLPVVSEAGFPNDHVVTESGLGFVVENGNLELMAERVELATHTDWNRTRAIDYILENHTWDKRVEVYDSIIKRELG